MDLYNDMYEYQHTQCYSCYFAHEEMKTGAFGTREYVLCRRNGTEGNGLARYNTAFCEGTIPICFIQSYVQYRSQSEEKKVERHKE